MADHVDLLLQASTDLEPVQWGTDGAHVVRDWLAGCGLPESGPTLSSIVLPHIELLGLPKDKRLLALAVNMLMIGIRYQQLVTGEGHTDDPAG